VIPNSDFYYINRGFKVEMFYFLNILTGFEIFVKFNPLSELGFDKNTQIEKKTIFLDFFKSAALCKMYLKAIK
jgi:hypothetical protein